MLTRGISAAVAALVVVVAASLTPMPATAADASVHKTLVIGIDGATFDSLAPADMPRLDAFRAAGTTSVSNIYGADMSGTWSGPGWSSIATGVWPDKHKVTSNTFTTTNFATYRDYLSRINAAVPSRNTAAYGTWDAITLNVFGSGVDVRLANTTDTATTAAVVQAITTNGADDVFVQLDDVDHAGHLVGTNGAAYRAALESTDAKVGQILDAVAARPSSEDWTIIITTDHGHTPSGGHGGNSLAERRVFVAATGAGIPAGVTRYDAKLVDVAPTMLAAAGVAIQPSWELDGTSIRSLAHDDFDAVRPQLQPRVDETGIPNTLLGWTQAAPAGWSIVNSAMPTGGVTELRGWTFMTDDFFTSLETGQWRETSVRGRDIIAVADSDEWDDKTHATGQFDSTLVSPKYPVAGVARANLVYATSYRVDGAQTATVTVTFDNGATQTLKSYSSLTNTVERLSFAVPAGAQTAQFRFRYTGQNSAYWMVDGVSVQDPIRADEILYAVNAGGLQTADWTALKNLAAADGTTLSNSTAEQAYGTDATTGRSWGYVSAGSGIDGTSSGTMFSNLRYAVSGRDLTYRFSGLTPGSYTVHAGYYDPWTQYADRGARVTINGVVRASDHHYTSENQAVQYPDVVVGADGELSFSLAKSRTPDVQLSWIIVAQADTVAPALTVGSAPASPSGSNGWFTGAASFTASASDPSGISSVEYQLNSGPWQPYSAPVAAAEGEIVFGVRATDTKANTSGVQTVTIRRDATAPVSQATAAQVGTVMMVTLTATDAGSGVGALEYRIDGGSWETYADPVGLVPGASHAVDFRARDLAGNVESSRTIAVAEADTAAPVVTVGSSPASPTGSGGWFIGPVSFTASATDASGISALEYQVSGGAWQPYTAPVIVAEGETVFGVRATDTRSNTSGVQTATIRRDATAPVSQAATAQVGAVAQITLAATDAGSGIAAIEYRVDGGEWQTYANPVALQSAGSHAVGFRAVDVAGNTETAQTIAVEVAAVPTLAATVTSRCVGSKAYLYVTVRNGGEEAANIEVSTPFGSKSFTAVGPGKLASLALNSRAASAPGDSVSIVGTLAGSPISVTQVVGYGAIACN